MKVAINSCYGGFGLSEAAYHALGLEWDGYGYEYSNYERRTDLRLIEVIEALGEKASGEYSKVKIVEIPDDVDWNIEEYDGMEWVAEAHRTWE